MVKTRKMLAVVLALVMLASCFVVSASALTYAPTNTTGEVVVVATADKTTVSAGDVVTITMSIDPGTKSSFSAFTLPVIYNGNQLTPTNTGTAFRTWLGDCAASFAKDEATVNMNYAVTNALGAAMTADEKAYYTKGIVVAGQTAGGATARWNPAAGGEDFVSFQFTVSNSVKDGDEIWVGFHQAAVTRNQGFFSVDNKRLNVADYNLTNSMVKLTVGSEAAPELSVKYMKDQIRFQKNNDGSYAGKFDYRILAELENFDEIFADLDDAKARISDVGFIFNKGAAIDMDAAKAQVEGGAKTYSQVGNIYVSTSFETGKYVMACFVGNIPDADKGTALSALAYVIYEQDGVTKYAYFDAAQTSPFTTLYNQYYPQAFGA